MTHLRLVLRMGQATGTDLVTAHRTGHLSQEDWAEMIRCCRGCMWAKQCPEWLNEREVAAAAPNRCPNRARFAALKRAQMEDA
ncbi:DUF6455 family protein [Ruegeria sp. SCPT10]|uniref:DUF6455 family protein n=1 Tax=Ruegeria sp. SCP10 TaxID=3141377 RepID=UPI003339E9DE